MCPVGHVVSAARSAQSVAGRSLYYTKPSTPGRHVSKIAKLANMLAVEASGAAQAEPRCGIRGLTVLVAAAGKNVGYT